MPRRPHWEWQRLLNVLVDEHHYGAIWGGVPLVACDVFEHAYYHKDGPARAKYIANFLAGLHWGRVNDRFKKYCEESTQLQAEGDCQRPSVSALGRFSEMSECVEIPFCKPHGQPWSRSLTRNNLDMERRVA